MRWKFSTKKRVATAPKLVPAWHSAKNSFAENTVDFAKYLNLATQKGNMTEFQHGVSADDSMEPLLAKWPIGGVSLGSTIKFGLP